MKPDQLLKKLKSRHFKNWKFSDAVKLVESLGFVHDRTSGSHQIFIHPEKGMMNLQNVKGEAKPYQLRQLLSKLE